MIADICQVQLSPGRYHSQSQVINGYELAKGWSDQQDNCTGSPNPRETIGYLDQIDGHGIASGWACDPDFPDASITVQFYVNPTIVDGRMPQGGTLVGQGAAGQYSEYGVYARGGGGWYHRYRIQLSGVSQNQRVYAVGLDVNTGSAYMLPGWRCSESPACVWSGANNYAPNGWVDGVDANGCISGWSCDRDNHDMSIGVRYYADYGASLVMTDTAGQGSEPAVNNNCGGGYYHRFRTCLPYWTKGHALSVYGVDSVTSGLTPMPCYNQFTCYVSW